jgi:NADH dehydrogenase
VTANLLTAKKDVFKIERGRIVVDEYMQALGVDDMYVIGDMSHCLDSNKKPYPMTAQIAKQQGILVGENLYKKSLGQEQTAFSYKERGILASLGNYDAVANISGISFFGFTAWFIWRTIYLFNFISWRKRFKIMLDWTINLFSERDISHL